MVIPMLKRLLLAVSLVVGFFVVGETAPRPVTASSGSNAAGATSAAALECRWKQKGGEWMCKTCRTPGRAHANWKTIKCELRKLKKNKKWKSRWRKDWIKRDGAWEKRNKWDKRDTWEKMDGWRKNGDNGHVPEGPMDGGGGHVPEEPMDGGGH
jgi:hypothetical protein